MAEEIIFRDDVTVELVKSSASDADVIWAARVSTAGEQSLDEIGEDPSRSAGLINYLARERFRAAFSRPIRHPNLQAWHQVRHHQSAQAVHTSDPRGGD